jgi:hypothetical protein
MFSRQVFYHLSHLSSPFYSGYFGNRVLHLHRLVWMVIFHFMLPTIADTTVACHHTQFFPIKMGFHLFFFWCSGRPGTTILLISGSWVVRIIGMSHRYLAEDHDLRSA